MDIQNMSAQFQGLYHMKTAWTFWTLVRKTRKICVVAFNYLVSVQDQLRATKYDLILAVRSQIFGYLRETFCGRALGYLGPAASKQNDRKNCFFFRKCVTTVDLLEGQYTAVLGGDTFFAGMKVI